MEVGWTKSEKCSSVQVPAQCFCVCGCRLAFQCVCVCVCCITHQKPWFVHKKPRGWRLQRETSSTLCLHWWQVVSLNNSTAADTVQASLTALFNKVTVIYVFVAHVCTCANLYEQRIVWLHLSHRCHTVRGCTKWFACLCELEM